MRHIKHGLASDSFKRSCFNWGIGRELYTAPFIWVDASKINITQGRNGRLTTRDKFKVEKIVYDDKGDISGLSIINQKNERVFVWQKNEKVLYMRVYTRDGTPSQKLERGIV